MNGNQIVWKFNVSYKDAPIDSYYRYAWNHAAIIKDDNYLVEQSLWDKIEFITQIK